MGSEELCMDQYFKIIGTCRVPNQLKDDLHVMQAHNFDAKTNGHIIVLYKNRVGKNFFKK